MNTKIIMTACAVLLAMIGLGLTFFSTELAAIIDTNISKPLELLVQLLGALYFGFAMLNWMAKGSTIGGIYNRPIAIANFGHFFIGGMALGKAVISNPELSTVIWILAFLYVVFAILFGILLYRNPVSATRLSTSGR